MTTRQSAFARLKASNLRTVEPNPEIPTNEFEILGSRLGHQKDDDRPKVTVDEAFILRGRTGFIQEVSDGCLHIRLRLGESVAVLGECELSVDKGIVEVLGARLSATMPPQSYELFALSTHSLPLITGVGNSFNDDKAGNSVFLKSVETGIQGLAVMSMAFAQNEEVLRADEFSDEQGSKRSFSIVGYDFQYDRKLHKNLIVFRPHETWEAIGEAITTSQHRSTGGSKIIICGPKNSGKSTMLKYLANKAQSLDQLQSGRGSIGNGVAILDLDPGQPEFGLPGTLSLIHVQSPLLGPSYTHSFVQGAPTAGRNGILCQRFFGSTTPKPSPGLFVECMLSLIAEFENLRRQFPRCHLIVNTSGWLSGVGLELLGATVRAVEPTNVVYMNDGGLVEVIDLVRQLCEGPQIRFDLIRSQAITVSRPAQVLRHMQLQSYLCRQTPRNASHLRWRQSNTKETGPTTVLRYSGLSPDICGIMTLGRRIQPDQLADYIEGALVAIVALDTLDALDSRNAIHEWKTSSDTFGERMPALRSSRFLRTTREQLPYVVMDMNQTIVVDPWRSHCLGFGLVRGIQSDAKNIILHTPAMAEDIKQAARREEQAVILVTMDSRAMM